MLRRPRRIWARRFVVKTMFPWVSSCANMLHLATHTHNRAAVSLHAAHAVALREIWTEWPHANTVLTTKCRAQRRTLAARWPRLAQRGAWDVQYRGVLLNNTGVTPTIRGLQANMHVLLAILEQT